MPTDPLSELQYLTRRRVRLVWEMAEAKPALLSNDDRVLVEVMRQHPEYAHLWPRLDELTTEALESDGTNPVVHITIHQTLENQLALGEPPEVTTTLERLLGQGKTRHEALHEMGAVLADELFDILKHKRPFNERRYVKKLQRLGLPKKLRRYR